MFGVVQFNWFEAVFPQRKHKIIFFKSSRVVAKVLSSQFFIDKMKVSSITKFIFIVAFSVALKKHIFHRFFHRFFICNSFTKCEKFPLLLNIQNSCLLSIYGAEVRFKLYSVFDSEYKYNVHD